MPGQDVQTELVQLADDLVELQRRAHPFMASVQGAPGYDAEVPDVSLESDQRLLAALDRIAERLDAIGEEGLPEDRHVTRGVIAHELNRERDKVRWAYIEFAVGAQALDDPVAGAASAHVLSDLPKLTLHDAQQAQDYLTRCRRLDAYLNQAAERLRAGIAAGRTPTARLVCATLHQLDRYLATSSGDDPLLLVPPPRGEGERQRAGGWGPRVVSDRWRADLAQVIETVVRPAMVGYRNCLADEVLPHARPDERCGVGWLADGEEMYRAAVALHTTTGQSVEEIHRLGLDSIDALAQEYRQLGAEVLGTSNLDEIFARLRTDPQLRFSSASEIRRSAAESLERAEQAVSAWFGRLPATPCVVREIPALEAPDSTIAYYRPPALDGTRPGAYFVNTSEPQTRTRFEAEVLAFHESVPGHHTQMALAQELELPALQRMTYIPSFGEGWGLYTERLADEMGLYSDGLARLGVLSFDSWRACRLVVDTGMHAMGWSRSRAVEFMREHSPQALNNIENEVDRYIAWPGQALAYMVGRTVLTELRDRARRALGAGFDIRGFHDTVLGHGNIPLWILEGLMDAWIDRSRQA